MIIINNYFPGKMYIYAMKFLEIFAANNIEYRIVDIHQVDFYELIRESKLFINYTGTDSIHLQQLKSVNTVLNKSFTNKIFPNYETSWHLDDKLAQFYLLSYNNFPVVDNYIFWDKEKALEFSEKTLYPIIFKLKGGAGSLNVCKVNNQTHAKLIISRMFSRGIGNGEIPGVSAYKTFNSNINKVIKSNIKRFLLKAGVRYNQNDFRGIEYGYVLFQKYLPDNNFDTRVTVIGNRAFAFRRFNRKNDFRSSGSGIIDYNHKKINLEAIKLAFEISERLSFQTMAYDILVDIDGNLKVIEMCHMFADWAVYNCEGYWDKNFNWIPGNYWPQYSQLVYLLGDEKLIQPKFKNNPPKEYIMDIPKEILHNYD